MSPEELDLLGEEERKRVLKNERRKLYFSQSDLKSRLEKYEEADMKDPINKKFMAFEDFKGPTRKLALNFDVSFLV